MCKMELTEMRINFGGTDNAKIKLDQNEQYLVIESPVSDNVSLLGKDIVRNQVVSELYSDLNNHEDLWQKLSSI